jgi:hypothetical protein
MDLSPANSWLEIPATMIDVACRHILALFFYFPEMKLKISNLNTNIIPASNPGNHIERVNKFQV